MRSRRAAIDWFLQVCVTTTLACNGDAGTTGGSSGSTGGTGSTGVGSTGTDGGSTGSSGGASEPTTGGAMMIDPRCLLDAPGVVQFAESDAGWSPDYAVATRHDIQDDPGQDPYLQYDILTIDDNDGAFGGSLLVHWNYGTPEAGVVYTLEQATSFEQPIPRVERLFVGDTSYAVTGGWVVYPTVGTEEGDLQSVCYSLDLENGLKAAGASAAALEIQVHLPAPP